MTLAVRAATPPDLERLLPLLDLEFIYRKGRHFSLAHRYPAVYCADNTDHIFIGEQGGEVISAVVCKPFQFIDAGRNRSAVMMGSVYTRPDRRGEGLASDLLKHVSESLRRNGDDLAVLWTTRRSFYSRLGWIAADTGVLGEFQNDVQRPAFASPGTVIKIPARDCDVAFIERIRHRWCRPLLPRNASSYRRLPLPADTVNVFLMPSGIAEASAYALVGETGGLGILYELIGHPDAFAILWSEIRRSHQRIIVNDFQGSLSQRWLDETGDITWHEKPLAMWLALNARADVSDIPDAYIPFFDRI